MTRQLTLRGFDPELERRLRELARREGISLNKAALKLLRRGAGTKVAAESRRSIGAALARFSGSMRPAEAAAIDSAVKELREADRELQA